MVPTRGAGRAAWLLVLLAVTACAAPGHGLRLVRADTNLDAETPVLEVGDRVMAEVDLGRIAEATDTLTRYDVRLLAPQDPGRMAPDALVRTSVPVDPPATVRPGEPTWIRWRFTVTPEMAGRAGRYRLRLEFEELGTRAEVAFTVR